MMSSEALDLWRSVSDMASILTLSGGPLASASMPRQPWLAVALLPSIGLVKPADLGRLGSFEGALCLAILRQRLERN